MHTERLLPGAVMFALTLVTAGVRAQEAGPPLPGTSQQRADTSLPDPLSPTTLGSLELEQRGITSLAGIAAATPALTLIPSASSSNTPLLYMRGQGLENPVQITRDPGVGVYEDGFYVARPVALSFDLLDLDHVDVLRGPQGALYGRDTSGGVVNLVSTAPAGELRFRQIADFGNRNMFRALASLDSPEWRGLSAKVTLLASSIDGYVRNTLPNSNDYGVERQRAGRLQLRWEALAGLRADYSLERSDLDSTPLYGTNPSLNGQFLYFFVPYYANPNGPTTTTYRPVDLALSTSDHVAHALTVTWQPGSAFSLRSLSSYRTLNADAKQDYAEFVGVAEQTDDLYTHYQLSQELQLTGNLWDQQLSVTMGGLYFKEHGRHGRIYSFATLSREIDESVTAETRSSAAYVRLHWQPDFLRRRLELSAGARYTKDVKDAERFLTDSAVGNEENGAANHLSYRRVNPTGSLSYLWTEGLSTYASVSSGYRAGGALESAPVGQFAANTFRPETLVTYEVGLKSAFLGSRVRAEVAAFTSTERDLQYAIPIDAVTDQVDPLQKATIRGVDVRLAVVPLRDLELSASAAFLHWTIDQALVLPGTPLDPASGAGSQYSVGENVPGLFALPYAPRYDFNAATDYTFVRWYSGDLRAHVDFTYRGQFYADYAAGPDVPGRQFAVTPSAGLLNAALLFTTGTDWSRHVKVGLWGRNLLNRRYYQFTGAYGYGVSAFQSAAAGAVSPRGWLALAGAWAEPPSYGLNLSYDY